MPTYKFICVPYHIPLNGALTRDDPRGVDRLSDVVGVVDRDLRRLVDGGDPLDGQLSELEGLVGQVEGHGPRVLVLELGHPVDHPHVLFERGAVHAKDVLQHLSKFCEGIGNLD